MRKKAAIIDYVYPGLTPEVWDSDGKLLQEVKDQIIDKLMSYLENEIDNFDWIKKTKIVGSLTSYMYNKESDLDIHIEVDIDKLLEVSGCESIDDCNELLKIWRKDLNDAELIGDSNHPLEYYFEIEYQPSPEIMGIYNVDTDTWEQLPISIDYDFDLEDIYPNAVSLAIDLLAEIDVELGELRRQVVTIERLQDVLAAWETDKREFFKKKIDEKLDGIEQQILELAEKRQEVRDDRHKDYNPFSTGEIKFKYLQKFKYLYILSRLEKILKEEGEITEDAIPRIKELLASKRAVDRDLRRIGKRAPAELTDEASRLFDRLQSTRYGLLREHGHDYSYREDPEYVAVYRDWLSLIDEVRSYEDVPVERKQHAPRDVHYYPDMSLYLPEKDAESLRRSKGHPSYEALNSFFDELLGNTDYKIINIYNLSDEIDISSGIPEDYFRYNPSGSTNRFQWRGDPKALYGIRRLRTAVAGVLDADLEHLKEEIRDKQKFYLKKKKDNRQPATTWDAEEPYRPLPVTFVMETDPELTMSDGSGHYEGACEMEQSVNQYTRPTKTLTSPGILPLLSSKDKKALSDPLLDKLNDIADRHNMGIYELKYMPIENLRFGNPIYFDETVDFLIDAIKESSAIKPLVVQNGVVIDGNHRLEALLTLGVETAPVYNWLLSEEQERRLDEDVLDELDEIYHYSDQRHMVVVPYKPVSEKRAGYYPSFFSQHPRDIGEPNFEASHPLNIMYPDHYHFPYLTRPDMKLLNDFDALLDAVDEDELTQEQLEEIERRKQQEDFTTSDMIKSYLIEKEGMRDILKTLVMKEDEWNNLSFGLTSNKGASFDKESSSIYINPSLLFKDFTESDQETKKKLTSSLIDYMDALGSQREKEGV